MYKLRCVGVYSVPQQWQSDDGALHLEVYSSEVPGQRVELSLDCELQMLPYSTEELQCLRAGPYSLANETKLFALVTKG